MSKSKKWQEWETEYLKAQHSHMNTAEIAEALGRAKGTIQHKLSSLGLKAPPKKCVVCGGEFENRGGMQKCCNNPECRLTLQKRYDGSVVADSERRITPTQIRHAAEDELKGRGWEWASDGFWGEGKRERFRAELQKHLSEYEKELYKICHDEKMVERCLLRARGLAA